MLKMTLWKIAQNLNNMINLSKEILQKINEEEQIYLMVQVCHGNKRKSYFRF